MPLKGPHRVAFCMTTAICLLTGVTVSAGEPADKKGPQSKASSVGDLLQTFHSEFVEITPGEGKFPKSFVMGSEQGPAAEQPAHEVTLRAPFWMARYEVPQNLFAAVMGTTASKWKGPRNSAENFTWAEAQQFCQKATLLMRKQKLLGDHEEIRLPTEAEWEYCCRAGTRTAYSFGASATAPGDKNSQATLLNAYGWHTGNAAGNDPPVGALKPNAWGLYDMHGYLWEFVGDAWHDSYQDAPHDGSRWASADPKANHVIRGGSWREAFPDHRCAFRRAISAETHDDSIGMRCVKAQVQR